jgi:hypothetical protein
MAAATETKSPSKSQAKTIGATELAKQIGVAPAELRKFLRTQDQKVGRGKRYQFDSKQAQAVMSSWEDAHKA